MRYDQTPPGKRRTDADGQPDLPSNPPSDELEIIEASYRVLAEPQAFDALVEAWRQRILQFERVNAAPLENGSLERASEAVAAIFARLPTPPSGKNSIEAHVADLDAPALVLSLSDQVIAINAAAADRFDLGVGRKTALDWVDPDSLSELDALRRSARLGGNRALALLKIPRERGISDLAEAELIDPEMGPGPLIVIRVMTAPWTPRVARLLREAFGLTDAETAVAEALYNEPDPARIAAIRGTSIRTVRTQLQRIFDKTEATGQVELIRLISLLCANHAGPPSPQARWRDPLGRERLCFDQAGRAIAYSWMGREGGRPALLCHGPLTGYVLAPAIQEAIEAADVQLFTICRPGFGNSDMGDGTALEDGTLAILTLAEHLGLTRCAGIGLVNGIVPLIEAAARRPERFARLLGIGSSIPMNASMMRQLPPVQRTVFSLARHAPKALDVVVAAGFHLARKSGPEFALQRMYAGSPADREAVFDPANFAQVMASVSMFLAQDGKAFAKDLALVHHDYRASLRADCPLHFLSGRLDPVFSIAQVAQFAAQGHCTYSVFERSGQAVHCSAPDLVADEILKFI